MRVASLLAVLVLAALGASADPEIQAGAADFTVDTNIDDPASDDCTPAVNYDCSLRGAIILANATAGAQTISIPAASYTLTSTGVESASTGDLDITDSMTLMPSGGVATINGGDTGDRVLTINCSAACTVNGSDLVITGGGPNLYCCGGGILVQSNATLQLDRSAVLENTIYAEEEAYGGGIFNSGVLRLSNSTVAGNQANAGSPFPREAQGGGIYSDATVILVNSTISGNSASGAFAPGLGGGLYHRAGSAALTNVTITANSADEAGGLQADAVPTLRNSTIAAQQFGTDCDAGTTSIDSLGNNNDSDNTCGLDQASDIPGVNPQLGELGPHGGLTANHLPMAGSPLLDKGDNTTCNGLTDAFGNPDATDQRGKPRKSAGDLVPGLRCDIGAAEFLAVKCNGKTPTLVGTNGPDIGIGTSGPNVVNLLAGADDFSGLEGDDTICGGRGADHVNGGAGADALSGGPGSSDDCFGGSGTDSFIGGSLAASGCETGAGIP
ncbi:MAG: choice-of-anchor Q domain-containing protein [Dehalococcoidia bacterium]